MCIIYVLIEVNIGSANTDKYANHSSIRIVVSSTNLSFWIQQFILYCQKYWSCKRVNKYSYYYYIKVLNYNLYNYTLYENLNKNDWQVKFWLISGYYLLDFFFKIQMDRHYYLRITKTILKNRGHLNLFHNKSYITCICGKVT